MECQPQDFCGVSNINHRITYDSQFTLKNWVQKFGLECEPASRIGLLGAAFFAGFTTSLLWMPRLADSYGRAAVLRYSLIPACAVIGTIYITTDLNCVISMLFILGILATSLVTIGYVNVFEFIPRRL